jgi:hypothetical protein
VPKELIRKLGIVEATYVWAAFRGEKARPAVHAPFPRGA